MRRRSHPLLPRTTWGPGPALGAGGGGVRLGRRAVLAIAAATPFLVAAGGELEAPRPRKARFEEVGDAVLMTIGLPELFSTADADAMAALEAAFATTLTYEITVFRTRERDPIEHLRVDVRIQWSAWKERYVVACERPGHEPTTRQFTDRDEAIAAAVTLERVALTRTAALERSLDASYFATIVGQRNPIDHGLLSPGSGAPGRESGAFARWLGLFIHARQRAERTVALKTSPAFYLVPR